MKAWSSFLKGQSTEFIFEDRYAISSTLDEWDGYFSIDVGAYNCDTELKRTLKTEAVNELVNVFDEWQASKPSEKCAKTLLVRIVCPTGDFTNP